MTTELAQVTEQRVTDIELARSVERMRDMIERAPAANTTAAYDRQWAAFERWCEARSLRSLPATGDCLALYVTDLTAEDKAPSTIEQAMAAIRVRHSRAGMDKPDNTRALEVLRTHKRDRAQSGKRKRQAPAVTLKPLRAMAAACDPATLTGLRNRTLVVLGFALMGRRSELAALRIEDVRFTDNGLVVHIATSKTDKQSVGEDVHVPFGSHPDTDPVRVVRAYLAALEELGVTSGPLLRRLHRSGSLMAGGITGKAVNEIIHKLALAADLPDASAWTAHGLRAGGPTEAALNGVPTAIIAEHGRWSKNSTQVSTYVRSADKWRNNPLAGIGL